MIYMIPRVFLKVFHLPICMSPILFFWGFWLISSQFVQNPIYNSEIQCFHYVARMSFRTSRQLDGNNGYWIAICDLSRTLGLLGGGFLLFASVSLLLSGGPMCFPLCFSTIGRQPHRWVVVYSFLSCYSCAVVTAPLGSE